MLSPKKVKPGHKFIQAVAVWGITATACLLVLYFFPPGIDLPEVYKDSITRECIAVVTAEGYQPCEEGNIPSRHHPILSAPGQTYEQIVAARNR